MQAARQIHTTGTPRRPNRVTSCRELADAQVRRPFGGIPALAITEWNGAGVAGRAHVVAVLTFDAGAGCELDARTPIGRLRAELFHEHRHLRGMALVDHRLDPFERTQPRAGPALSADDHPIELRRVVTERA